MALIGFAGTEDGRRPLGFVGTVGVVLCFETDAGTLIVDLGVLAGDCAVKEVAGVDLDAGFVGEDTWN